MEKIYTLNEIQEIVTPILQQYGVSRAYIFGSYARGEATEESDIDFKIAAESPELESMFGLGALYQELTETLEKPIDLVTEDALSDVINRERVEKFRHNIEKDEYLIYEERY